MSAIEFYRCSTCGNIVALLKSGGGTLTCCGQAMTKLIANSTDAATEKHVPVVEKKDGGISVTVGSTLHPMQAEHYIEWIALETAQGVQIKYLKPGDAPKAAFPAAESGTAYAYCNLHGLWKAEF
jgi:superoxide reductase